MGQVNAHETTGSKIGIGRVMTDRTRCLHGYCVALSPYYFTTPCILSLHAPDSCLLPAKDAWRY